MMTRIRAILKDRRGAISFPLIVAITLALVMIFAGISEYLRLLIIAQGVRDAVQSAVIATVTENYANVYHGVREGYSGAYQPVVDDFEISINYGDVYRRMDSTLGLTRNAGYHVKRTASGEMEYRVWGLTISIQNAPFAQGDLETQRFNATCLIELETPVSFGGSLLSPMQITVKTNAGYTPQF